MVDISLTSWLDPVLGWFADQAKLDKADYVSQTGGEGIAVAAEFFSDLFLNNFWSKLAQGLTGIGIGCYGIWGPDVNSRLKKELIAIANHMEMRVLDPKPSDMIEIRKNIDGFINAFKLGDPAMIWNNILRSVDEIARGFEALGIPTGVLPVQQRDTPIALPGPAKRIQTF